MEFKNLETKMMAKWYGNKIEALLEGRAGQSKDDLVCLLSENLEELVKEDVALLTEGYVSELIGESFENVDYSALVDYFKPEEPPVKEFDVVVKMQLSTMLSIEASSKEEAIQKARKDVDNGEIFAEYLESEYSDGITDIDVE